MTVYVRKNSDINTVIPPYASLSGSLKPHGNNTTWCDLVHTRKVSLLPAKITKPRCFSYFLWFAFSAKDQILELLTTAWIPITAVMYQLTSLTSAVVSVTLGRPSWVLVGLCMTFFKGLKRKFKTQPLLWEHWHKQNKIDMVAVYSSLKCSSLKLSKEI